VHSLLSNAMREGVRLLTLALQGRCKVTRVHWPNAGPRSVSEGSLGATRC